MELPEIKIGSLQVSKFILGSNPFSGFSHQGSARDLEMKKYFTVARIKQVLRQAEKLGINTIIARADHHIMRLLLEYWEEGGKLQWLAQTCPELGSIQRGVENAITGGAKGCYVHGGVMDNLYSSRKLEQIPLVIEMIKKAGLVVGIAGHDVRVFSWAEENLDADFYMCSYYNPVSRVQTAEHRPGSFEKYRHEDRLLMAEQIKKLSRPVIHYKVMAAGRNDPVEAFSFVVRNLRDTDAVCVGIYPKEKPDMLETDVRLLIELLNQKGS